MVHAAQNTQNTSQFYGDIVNGAPYNMIHEQKPETRITLVSFPNVCDLLFGAAADTYLQFFLPRFFSFFFHCFCRASFCCCRFFRFAFSCSQFRYVQWFGTALFKRPACIVYNTRIQKQLTISVMVSSGGRDDIKCNGNGNL